MRRMRDSKSGLWVAGAVVIAAGFGTYPLLGRWLGSHADAPKTTDKTDTAATGKAMGEDSDSRWGERKPAAEAHKTKSKLAHEPEVEFGHGSQSVSANSAVVDPLAGVSSGSCAPVEFAGRGGGTRPPSAADWAQVMDMFHHAKKDLAGWLENHRAEFPKASYDVMAGQVTGLTIQRPPTPEEPDLTWRGIGTWTYDAESHPIVRVGDGFIRMALKYPRRARFEMTRWVAQSWAPCHLEAQKLAHNWAAPLDCLGVDRRNDCGTDSASEGGWAISTALAFQIAPPGCQIPAFAEPKFQACLKLLESPPRAPASSAAAEPASALHEEHHHET